MAVKKGTSIISNADNEGLHPRGTPGFCIGYVEEVNGDGAVEIPEFVATRDELSQLLKFWFREKLEIAFFYLNYAQVGSSDWRKDIYSNRRITRISEFLAEDDIKKATEEAHAELRKGWKISDSDWDVFMNGTPEQWKQHQDEVQRLLESQTNPENKK